MIAVRHPELVRRAVTCSATFGPPDTTLDPATTHFDRPPTADSDYIEFQRDNYKRVAPHPEYWPRIFDKVGSIQWEGFSKEELASIKMPFLILVGDRDFVRVEHSLASFRQIPNAELAVIPDAGHFALFSEPGRVIPIIKHFLEKPAHEIPVATARTGYHPGKTR